MLKMVKIINRNQILINPDLVKEGKIMVKQKEELNKKKEKIEVEEKWIW